jgi:hypothetical protein
MPKKWSIGAFLLLAGWVQLFGQTSGKDQPPDQTPTSQIGYQSAPDAYQ